MTQGYSVPRPVFESRTLTAGAKLLWALIDRWSYKTGYCQAKRANLARFLGVGERSIVRWAAQLEREGYLKRFAWNGRANQLELTAHPSFYASPFERPRGAPLPPANPTPAAPPRGVPTPRKNDTGHAPKVHRSRANLARHYKEESFSFNSSLLEADRTGHHHQQECSSLPTAGQAEGAPAAVPEKSDVQNLREAAIAGLTARGVTPNGAQKAAEKLPADYPIADVFEYLDGLVLRNKGKWHNPPGFYLSMLSSGMRPPAHWESPAQFRARQERERGERELAELPEVERWYGELLQNRTITQAEFDKEMEWIARRRHELGASGAIRSSGAMPENSDTA
jgi:hypothetical protein